MSTGCECEFVEHADGTWTYWLEDYHAPKNSWDWHDHAEEYGPFKSYPEAVDHLSANHANPGGWSVHKYEEHNDA